MTTKLMLTTVAVLSLAAPTVAAQMHFSTTGPVNRAVETATVANGQRVKVEREFQLVNGAPVEVKQERNVEKVQQDTGQEQVEGQEQQEQVEGAEQGGGDNGTGDNGAGGNGGGDNSGNDD